MIARLIVRTFGAAAIASLLSIPVSWAQPQPSPAAVALATQLLEVKGGISVFDPAVEGVIVHHKGTLLRINPMLAKDVNEIEKLVRADIGARRQALHREVAQGYASMFTEQDLKDMIAFYKTPLGKKIIEQEPKAAAASAKLAQVWIDKYATDVMAKMRAEMKKRGHNEY